MSLSPLSACCFCALIGWQACTGFNPTGWRKYTDYALAWGPFALACPVAWQKGVASVLMTDELSMIYLPLSCIALCLSLYQSRRYGRIYEAIMRHPVVEFVPAWRRDTLLEKVMEDRPDARNLEVIRQLKANKAITFDAHEQGVDIFLGNKYLFSLKDFTWLKTQIENLDARDADPLVARCNLTAMKRVYFT